MITENQKASFNFTSKEKVNEMSQLRVGCSPLIHRIYCGKVTKKGLWAKDKHDITDEAVSAVALHLLLKGERVQFEYKGETYNLKVSKGE